MTKAVNPWRLLGGEVPAEMDLVSARAWSRRLGELVSPALAHWLTARAAERAGASLVDPEWALKARLYNRFTRASQCAALASLVETESPLVCLKGFANAHMLYPDPDIRIVGDLDILVRRSDLDSLARLLGARGFRFEKLPAMPWGSIAGTSYLPMVSRNGVCAIDIHVEADSHPLARGLPASLVFARAQTFRAGPLTLMAPAREHGLVILASHAAKDKFGPLSLRKTVDAMTLLAQPAPLEWPEIGRIVARARLAKPFGVFLALLRRLGARTEGIPEKLFGPDTGRTFHRLVEDYLGLFPEEPSAMLRLTREFALGAAPSVAVARAVRRLRGLIYPASGAPPGWSVD